MRFQQLGICQNIFSHPIRHDYAFKEMNLFSHPPHFTFNHRRASEYIQKPSGLLPNLQMI